MARRISLLIIALTFTLSAWAHELAPSIADLDTNGNTATLAISTTIEPFIAKVDQDGLLNTDTTAQSAEVDRLRLMDPAALEAEFRAYWPEMSQKITAIADGTRLEWRLDAIAIGEIGNPALPRNSVLRLSAALPTEATELQFGWDKTFGDLILRHVSGPETADGYTAILSSGRMSDVITIGAQGQSSVWQDFSRYVISGFDHIIPKGLDHILFVLGLFFLSTRLKPLLWQVSAFTAAHTVTLALAATGVVTVPGHIVEPLIAASIVYVAVENILAREMTPWRPFVVFGFGLLHGLGFASVLSDFGLGGQNFVAKLLGFNIGVEIGQLAVIAIAFLLVGLWFGQKTWYRKAISIPASIIIAAIGAYWCIERTLL